MMTTMRLTRVAALFCVACAACSKQAPESASPRSADEAKATASAVRSCPDLTAGLESIQMISQGSHALARHDLTVNVATGELSGQSYTLSDSDSKPYPRPVERTITAEENDKLLGSLKKICQPIQPTGAQDPTAAPGGYTLFIVSHTGSSPGRLVLAAHAQSAAQYGQHYLKLTKDERSAIASSWPAAAISPPLRAMGDYWPACEGEGLPFATPYSGAVDSVISLVRYTDEMPYELINAKLDRDPSENGGTPPVSAVLCIEMARTQLEQTCSCDYPPSPTGVLRAPRRQPVVRYHRGEGVIRLVRADSGAVLRTQPFTIAGASCPDPCITMIAERDTTADMSALLGQIIQ